MYYNLLISRKLSTLAQTHSKIRTLVQQGKYLEALKLHSTNPIHTSRFTYPTLLKACAFLSNLHHGKTLHSTIVIKGFHFDPYIASSLISMYVNCWSLASAVNVFDKLPVSEVSTQDVTIWNAIIDGYFRFGRVREGLVHLWRMQSLGVRPDAYTLCSLLGEYSGQLGYFGAKQIHGFMVRNMLSGDSFLDTALIDRYFSCGRPMDAYQVFQELDDKSNTAAWNVMIGGLSQNDLWENSLELYTLAKRSNTRIDSSSLASTLSASCHGEYVSFGKQVHCDVIKMDFKTDKYVCSSLLSMYGRHKLLKDAEKVFDEVQDKEVELCNAMISAYVGNGSAYDALKTYKLMRLYGLSPDSFTVSNILALGSMDELYNFGWLVHTEVVKRPIQTDIAVQSSLLTMYSKCGSSNDADLIFSAMKERDLVAWGSMISGFFRNMEYNRAIDCFRTLVRSGLEPDSDILTSVICVCTALENVDLGSMVQGLSIKIGLELNVFVASSLIDMYSKCNFPEMAGNVFSAMPTENLVAWNSLISCYCWNGLPELSISLFSQIVQHGLYPDSVSVTSVLTAVSSVASLLKGRTVHGYLIRLNIPSDLHVENSLIDMYIKCGFLKYAQNVFQNMSHRNLVTWNSMIAGYGSHGKCSKAMSLFYEMRSSGITPDNVTFLSLLSSCNHSGFVEEGLKLFELMKLKYGIEPRVEHYTNIVDLLGRAGRLDDAYSFVKSMPTEPDRSIWLSLLCSCRAHRNVELGELAAHRLFEIEPDKSSNYVLLLNVYREAGLWDRASKLRAEMKEKGLKKSPGCSWIEVGNKVDVFFSGDCSSPVTVQIYEALTGLKMNMLNKLLDDSENFEAL